MGNRITDSGMLILQVIRILTRRQRLATLTVFAAGLIANALDLLGLALLVPTIAIVSSNETPAWFQNYQVFSNVGRQSAIPLILVGLVTVFVVKNIMSWLAMVIQLRYSTGLIMSLRDTVFRSRLNNSFERFVEGSNAERIRNVENSVSVVTSYLLPIITLFVDLVFFAGAFILLVVVSPLGTVLVVGILGLTLFLVQRTTSARLRDWGESRRLADQASLATMSDAFNSFKEILLTNSEAHFAQAHQKALDVQRQKMFRFGVLSGTSRYLFEVIGLLSLAGFVAVGLNFGGDSEDVIAGVVILGGVLIRSLPIVNRVMNSLQTLRFGTSTVRSVIKEVEDSICESSNFSNYSPTSRLAFEVLEARGITYQHPSATVPLLYRFALRIERGDRIAIIGPSGVGKSTLIEVLLGLREIQEGTVLCNGQPIQEIRNALWHIVGYVPQQVSLIDGSVRENIGFGLDTKFLDTRHLSRLEEMIDLPTDLVIGTRNVGDSGIAVSGGQRQRIGLARALYRQPQILILDEATSNVDPVTKQKLLDAVDELDPELTVLHITHDATVAKRCSQQIELHASGYSKK